MAFSHAAGQDPSGPESEGRRAFGLSLLATGAAALMPNPTSAQTVRVTAGQRVLDDGDTVSIEELIQAARNTVVVFYKDGSVADDGAAVGSARAMREKGYGVIALKSNGDQRLPVESGHARVVAGTDYTANLSLLPEEADRTRLLGQVHAFHRRFGEPDGAHDRHP